MPRPRKIDPRSAARRGVPQLRPYTPGRPIAEVREQYGLGEVVKLASNECPLPPPPGLLDALHDEAGNIGRYPDGNCRRLAAALAERLGVPAECLVFGNGAEECIRLAAQAFLNPGESAVQPTPIFDAYETATLLAGAESVQVPLKDFSIDLDAMLDAVNERTKLVWLCTPANPSGTVTSRRALERFLERLPDGVVVVVDEAYRELVDNPEAVDALEHLFKDDRVLSLRTFSKVYGLAGLRVGYVVAHPEMAELMAKVKLPFNVNSQAQAAALYMLEHPEFGREHAAMIRAERERLAREFAARGMFTVPTQTNFLLVELPMDVDVAFEKLMERGFIIRPGSIWGLARYMRLSVGTPEHNTRFLGALDEVCAQFGEGS
jgi:histidinol-phosphate aminotransferase